MTEIPSARSHASPSRAASTSGAVRRTLSAASQPPHHNSLAGQIELRGNVTNNKQRGEAFTLGVKAK